MPFSPLLIIAGMVHRGFNYMGPQWCLGLVLVLVYLAHKVWVRTGSLVSALFLYLMVSGVLTFALPDPSLADKPQLQMTLTTGALSAMVFLLAFVVVFINFSEIEDAAIKKCFGLATLINSAYVIIGQLKEWLLGLLLIYRDTKFPLHDYAASLFLYLEKSYMFGRLSQGVGVSGFIDYSGMNACLIAIGIPFIKIRDDRKRWAAYLCAILAIIFSKSSVPYGVLGAVMFSEIITNKKSIDWRWLIPIPLTACSALALEGGRLLDSAGRFSAYKLFFSAWAKDANLIFGTGPGSFQMIAPIVQLKNGFMINQTSNSYFWLWAHSDWFQALLENGIIGVTLAASVFFVCLYRLYKKGEYDVLSMLCGIGAAAVFDFPLRYFIFSFLSCYAIARAYL